MNHCKEIHKSILNPLLTLEEDQSIWHLRINFSVRSIKRLKLVSGKPQKTCDLDELAPEPQEEDMGWQLSSSYRG